MELMKVIDVSYATVGEECTPSEEEGITGTMGVPWNRGPKEKNGNPLDRWCVTHTTDVNGVMESIEVNALHEEGIAHDD